MFLMILEKDCKLTDIDQKGLYRAGYVPNPYSNPPAPRSKGGLIYPPMTLPFIGSWKKPIGMGIKKRS